MADAADPFPAALVWWGAVQQLGLGEPWDNNPAPDDMLMAFLLIFGVVMPLVLLNIRLMVSVSDAIYLSFFPFTFKRWVILPQEISNHHPRQYRPIVEYGGWGIKGTSANHAYNISGDKGVKLCLSNGNTVMIGSQKAEELNMAIDTMMRAERR